MSIGGSAHLRRSGLDYRVWLALPVYAWAARGHVLLDLTDGRPNQVAIPPNRHQMPILILESWASVPRVVRLLANNVACEAVSVTGMVLERISLLVKNRELFIRMVKAVVLLPMK